MRRRRCKTAAVHLFIYILKGAKLMDVSFGVFLFRWRELSIGSLLQVEISVLWAPISTRTWSWLDKKIPNLSYVMLTKNNIALVSGNPAPILERGLRLLTPSCRKWDSIDLADRRGVKGVHHLACFELVRLSLRAKIARVCYYCDQRLISPLFLIGRAH